MYDIYGTEWCGTCNGTKKHLTAIDVPYTFTVLPAGPRGWEIAEELSGRRAMPVILKNGVNMHFDEFKAEINALGRKPRELTQHELDELDE
jgi:glutaredoxin